MMIHEMYDVMNSTLDIGSDNDYENIDDGSDKMRCKLHCELVNM
jgi:hypothetical protein